MPMMDGKTCMKLAARAMQDKSLTANDLRVLMRLGELDFAGGGIFIGQKKLGQQVGGLHRKTINSIISKLETRGYLRKLERHSDYHTLMLELVDDEYNPPEWSAEDDGPDDDGGPGGGQGLPVASAEAVDAVAPCHLQEVTGGVTAEGDRGCNAQGVTGGVTPAPGACNPHEGDRGCNAQGGTECNNYTKKTPFSSPCDEERRGDGAGRAVNRDPTPLPPAPLCGAGGLPREPGSAEAAARPPARQHAGGAGANGVRSGGAAADPAAGWAAVLAALRKTLGEATWRSWIAPLTLAGIADGPDGRVARVLAAGRFAADAVAANHGDALRAACARHLGAAQVEIGARPRARRAAQ